MIPFNDYIINTTQEALQYLAAVLSISLRGGR